MNIYNDNRIPYFYIIKHKPSSMLYAGAKWGRDANPNNFMTIDGYQTSQKKSGGVLSLIARDGLESFEIVQLLLENECDGLSVFEYESKFLQDNNIAKNPLWLNAHNNTNSKHIHGDVELFCQTEKGKLQWSETRKQYLDDNPTAKEALITQLTTMNKDPINRKEKSINMMGSKNHFFGKTHTKESLDMMSKSLKGRDVWNDGLTKETSPQLMKLSISRTENNPVAIRIKDSNGNVFNSIIHAARFYDVPGDFISKHSKLNKPIVTDDFKCRKNKDNFLKLIGISFSIIQIIANDLPELNPPC